MQPDSLGPGTLITIGTAICGALVTAIGFIYRELAAVRKRNEERQEAIVAEMKADREKCEEARQECTKQHLETREELAELRGRLDAQGSVRSLVEDTIDAMQKREGNNEPNRDVSDGPAAK